ncbi:1-phosphofructokinase family hexose kinase [Desemzia sp. RIT804]|uniref:1-phosphofructokinase family hexose kinase n=1 Tax=Desemzia sp. RIT 804 TaxID=2810209 RepID=UPI00195097E6|nr:1-phosphofructokinase family hexose kinase [Desemzia sp. RIT 804]MBM6615271.1 1-phosphofructokinase family hexose kinase [Desemzia sp. RIT 804]
MIYTITLNPTIDRLLFLEGTLTKGKNNRLRKVAYDIGGKGHHGSYAMNQSGVKNQALGFSGTINASKLEKILSDKGINYDFVEVYGKPTRESYVILEEKVGGSILITEKGFNITDYDIGLLFEKIEHKVQREDMVLIAGSVPPGFDLHDLENLLKQLKKIGCFIACDLSGEALKKAVEIGVDFIKPNQFEVQELIPSDGNFLEPIKELSKKIKYVIVSLGKDGSVCSHAGEVHQVSAPTVELVNDTGAGDCFVGTFLASLSLSKSLAECLSLASACAANQVQYNDSTTFNIKDARKLQKEVTVKKLS